MHCTEGAPATVNLSDRSESQGGVSTQSRSETNDSSKMTIPDPQNVIRMPPVNWAQYHVVGESLDRLHEEQRLRPTGGIPAGGDPSSLLASTRKEAVVAAPYDPFVDVLDSKSKPSAKREAPHVEEFSTPVRQDSPAHKTRRKSGSASTSGGRKGR